MGVIIVVIFAIIVAIVCMLGADISAFLQGPQY